MISFDFIDLKSPPLKKQILKKQITELIKNEQRTIGDLSIVFCSDEYLLKINQDFLKHDYFTDIITFDYSESNKVSGDLMISLDRLKENAQINAVVLNHELSRVVFHGVLHLCGYKDKSPTDKKQMTSKENFYLDFFAVPRETP